ncbi:ribbon-helix-helix domain-containing protein [Bosea sp. SSUT16]|jgi:predicted DNA-binding ribbon-helix-helix protein|uniref:Ribbon-helix-helix domain-containing protein n=1 Tax=Bosea spartocytisi TaxID=2773451 RepID=A0A927E7P5_9HYPH|nr:ribbon-helix-helix domain-containing protein [Bosea spartocytisi]MBD3846306.1 ribbon-helix-helix domain-containing protein [Bosea spartocytisi]MCT4471852.1 ribbon-helix-helix domain-containing protein [Bosea spartocytisi]
MCRLFVGADAGLWQTRLKSVRMRGYSTSVRLENLYWRVLEEIAQRDGMTLMQLLTRLHEELLETRGEVENFSSFLRVCCGRYLALQLEGDVPQDRAIPIRDLDAESILAREARRRDAEGRHLAVRRETDKAVRGASLSGAPVP